MELDAQGGEKMVDQPALDENSQTKSITGQGDKDVPVSDKPEDATTSPVPVDADADQAAIEEIKNDVPITEDPADVPSLEQATATDGKVEDTSQMNDV